MPKQSLLLLSILVLGACRQGLPPLEPVPESRMLALPSETSERPAPPSSGIGGDLPQLEWGLEIARKDGSSWRWRITVTELPISGRESIPVEGGHRVPVVTALVMHEGPFASTGDAPEPSRRARVIEFTGSFADVLRRHRSGANQEDSELAKDPKWVAGMSALALTHVDLIEGAPGFPRASEDYGLFSSSALLPVLVRDNAARLAKVHTGPKGEPGGHANGLIIEGPINLPPYVRLWAPRLRYSVRAEPSESKGDLGLGIVALRAQNTDWPEIKDARLVRAGRRRARVGAFLPAPHLVLPVEGSPPEWLLRSDSTGVLDCLQPSREKGLHLEVARSLTLTDAAVSRFDLMHDAPTISGLKGKITAAPRDATLSRSPAGDWWVVEAGGMRPASDTTAGNRIIGEDGTIRLLGWLSDHHAAALVRVRFDGGPPSLHILKEGRSALSVVAEKVLRPTGGLCGYLSARELHFLAPSGEGVRRVMSLPARGLEVSDRIILARGPDDQLRIYGIPLSGDPVPWSNPPVGTTASIREGFLHLTTPNELEVLAGQDDGRPRVIASFPQGAVTPLGGPPGFTYLARERELHHVDPQGKATCIQLPFSLHPEDGTPLQAVRRTVSRMWATNAAKLYQAPREGGSWRSVPLPPGHKWVRINGTLANQDLVILWGWCDPLFRRTPAWGR